MACDCLYEVSVLTLIHFNGAYVHAAHTQKVHLLVILDCLKYHFCVLELFLDAF